MNCAAPPIITIKYKRAKNRPPEGKVSTGKLRAGGHIGHVWFWGIVHVGENAVVVDVAWVGEGPALQPGDQVSALDNRRLVIGKGNVL